MTQQEPGRSRAFAWMFVVALLTGLMALTAVAASSFSDDDGNVHEGNIEAIAAAGITRGCNPPVNDLYCPADRVTRGQMAAFLVRALGYTDDGGGDKFTDDNESVFEGDIDRLATAGVTYGCNPPANTEFCPDSYVTRGQMAAFLVRAMGYGDDGGGDRFIDDNESVFEGDIERLATAGVTLGCNPPTNDRFCPDDPVLRDQMASFLARALDLDPITPSTTTTTVPGANRPRSGDGWHFEGCENATGTCTYSGVSESVRLRVSFDELPPSYCVVWSPITGHCQIWGDQYHISWYDEADDQQFWVGPIEETDYDTREMVFLMPVAGRDPGEYRGVLCYAPQGGACESDLLTAYCRIE